jgi:hypothetical protein
LVHANHAAPFNDVSLFVATDRKAEDQSSCRSGGSRELPWRASQRSDEAIKK